MAGQRKARDIDLQYQPGVITNLTDRTERTRWKDASLVRWFRGLMEKIGGYRRLTLGGVNGGRYTGVCRSLHDWSSLDTQQWIALGCSCGVYLVNNSLLYDITPVRKTSTILNSLSVVLGSDLITVVDPDHRASDGDHVTITASVAVGGFLVDGKFDIVAVIDPDSYTVRFTSAFSLTQTGGGSVSVAYDIPCGLPQNGERRGYGTGLYGAGTYGTPRPVGSGVPARMQIVSMDNWGEDLVFSPSDGEIYWWDKSTGPNSKAVLLESAPTDVQRILINPENRFLIAIGCSDLEGAADPMRVRWCSQEDFNDWIPTQENTAGGKRLDYGSRLITGIRSRGQNLLWSDTQMYSMQFVQAPLVFGFNPLGAMKLVGPNAVIDINGSAYGMAFDDFFIYDGTLRMLDCEVHTRVFGDPVRNIAGDFDRTQAEGVYCASYMAKSEVVWFYPTVTGGIRYVTYNYSSQPCWYFGQLTRTAYHDVTEALTGYKTNPYGVNDGYLYEHEIGTDAVDGVTSPLPWFAESYDNNIGGSDAVVIVNALIPDFSRLSGSMLMTLRKKGFPQQASYQDKGPYLIDTTTVQNDVRARASQIALRLESNNTLGEDFRMGVFQINATPYGGRVGRHSAVVPVAPVLSGAFVAIDVSGSTFTMDARLSTDFGEIEVLTGFADVLLPPGAAAGHDIGALSGDYFGYTVLAAYKAQSGEFVLVLQGATPPAITAVSSITVNNDSSAVTLATTDAISSEVLGLNARSWSWGGSSIQFTDFNEYTLGSFGASSIITRLNWTAASVTGALIVSYTIYRNVDGGPFTALATVDGAVLTYDDAAVSLASVYDYYVIALADNTLNSLTSNIIALSAAFNFLTSRIYPIEDIETMTSSGVPLFVPSIVYTEALAMGGEILSGSLNTTLRTYSSAQAEALDIAGLINSGSLRVALKSYSNAQAEALDISGSIQSGTLRVALVSYVNSKAEALDITGSILSGTLT